MLEFSEHLPEKFVCSCLVFASPIKTLRKYCNTKSFNFSVSTIMLDDITHSLNLGYLWYISFFVEKAGCDLFANQ